MHVKLVEVSLLQLPISETIRVLAQIALRHEIFILEATVVSIGKWLILTFFKETLAVYISG